MRPQVIFIVCLVVFAQSWLAHGEFSQGPDKCCFSFSNVRIPLKKVVSYHTTHLECHNNGIIFVTSGELEICADPSEKWVQRLKGLVDTRTLKNTKPDDTD